MPSFQTTDLPSKAKILLLNDAGSAKAAKRVAPARTLKIPSSTSKLRAISFDTYFPHHPLFFTGIHATHHLVGVAFDQDELVGDAIIEWRQHHQILRFLVPGDGHDQTENGSRFRILTLIDEHSRVCLATHAGWSIRAQDVITVVEAAFIRYGKPKHPRSDNGPEFIAQAI